MRLRERHIKSGSSERPLAALRSARRILLVRLDNIGDVIMLGPAVRALKSALPEAHLTLMASPAGRLVAPLVPGIDATITESTIWQDVKGSLPLDKRRELKQAKRLERYKFDAAIIFTSFSQSPYPAAFVCYLAGIPVRIGQSREFGGTVLTDRVRPPPADYHQVERNLHLLQSIGIIPCERDLELRVDWRSDRVAMELLKNSGLEEGERFVAIVPGASCQARRYPSEKFAVVAERFVRDGFPVVLLGSPKERQAFAEAFGSCSKQINNLIGMTDLPHFAAIVSRAHLVVANDSAAMHIADAYRRPMVILFSGTDLESQWQPRSSRAVLLRKSTECAPCYHLDCPYERECLDIDPSEVVTSGYQLLENGGSPYRHDRLVETFLEGIQ